METKGLITRIQNSDRAAFNELFGLYYSQLVAYASLIVGEDDADDIVQEVFLKVWQKRRSLRTDTPVKPYLYKSIYNQSVDVLRQRESDRKYKDAYSSLIEAEILGELAPDVNPVISELYSREIGREIDKAVEALPPRCREIFRMSYMDGRSAKEIASELGISTSTVNNQVFKALKLLRERLDIFHFLALLLVIRNIF